MSMPRGVFDPRIQGESNMQTHSGDHAVEPVGSNARPDRRIA